MTEEVVVTTGKALKIGDERWVIRDPGTPVVLIDFITEARQFNGLIYMSFAHSIIDAGNEGDAVINARLRMNLAVAQNIRDLLTRMIDDALKPVDQSKAN